MSSYKVIKASVYFYIRKLLNSTLLIHLVMSLQNLVFYAAYFYALRSPCHLLLLHIRQVLKNIRLIPAEKQNTSAQNWSTRVEWDWTKKCIGNSGWSGRQRRNALDRRLQACQLSFKKKTLQNQLKTLKTQKLQKTLQKDRKGEVVTLPRLLTYVNALLMNFLSAM